MSSRTEDDIRFRSVVQNLTPNVGAELIRYGWRKEGVLSLGQGEGDIPTPDFVIKAAHKALEEGQTMYGPVLGHGELREEISAYYRRIYSLGIDPERVFVTGSGTTAMHLALTALLDKGDEVVAVTPIWKNLLGAVELAQSQIKDVPLDEDEGRWTLDLDKLFDACTDKTKVILITTPSNPTGWTMTRDEMKAVIELARKRGLWILSDEVYGRLTYDEPHAPSFLEFAGPEDRVFTVNSFSKAWAMTGWRLGWLVGPKKAEEPIRDIALYDNMGPPSFSQFGAIEALKQGEPFIEQQKQLWRGNMDILEDAYRQTGRITAHRPVSTFYSFFQVDGEPDCLAFGRRLIDDVGLSIAPGCSFGKVGRGYMRLCFAVSENRLNEAMDRLHAALHK